RSATYLADPERCLPRLFSPAHLNPRALHSFPTRPLPISPSRSNSKNSCCVSEHSTAGAPTTGHPCERSQVCVWIRSAARSTATRSEEHTSELQSLRHLVCRLLLEKKKAY